MIPLRWFFVSSGPLGSLGLAVRFLLTGVVLGATPALLSAQGFLDRFRDPADGTRLPGQPRIVAPVRVAGNFSKANHDPTHPREDDMFNRLRFRFRGLFTAVLFIGVAAPLLIARLVALHIMHETEQPTPGPGKEWGREVLGFGPIRVGSLLALGLFLCGLSGDLQAQEWESSGSDPLGGAILGASSGTVFGLLGGVAVCNRALLGANCPRVSAALGGVVGGMSGAILGDRNAGHLDDRWRGTGYGLLAGGLVGLGLSKVARQYGWTDVGALAAVGGAVGSSPTGAGIGFGIGAVLGTVGVLAIPEMKVGDAVGLSVAGLAIGGLAGWIVGAVDAKEERGLAGTPMLVIPFEIRF